MSVIFRRFFRGFVISLWVVLFSSPLLATQTDGPLYVRRPGFLVHQFKTEIGERDVNFVINNSRRKAQVASTKLIYEGDFALNRYLIPYIQLGTANFKAGSALDGDMGFLIGTGIRFSQPLSQGFFLSEGVEYQHWRSRIKSLNADVSTDNFQVSGLIGREFELGKGYVGTRFSLERSDLRGNNVFGKVQINGEEDKKFGIFTGGELKLTPQISISAVGNFIDELSFRAGLTFRFDLNRASKTGHPEARIRKPRIQKAARRVEAPVTLEPQKLSQGKKTVEDILKERQKTAESLKQSQNSAVNISGMKPAQLHKIAYGAFQQGDYDRAIDLYLLLEKTNSKDYRVQYNLASAYYLKKQYFIAARLYRKLGEQRPLDLNPPLFEGFSYYKLKQWPSARKAWERVLQIDPSNKVARNNLSILNSQLR